MANVESDKPKRAPTAYFIFLAEFRKEMSGKKLDGDQKIPALAGEKWRSMTDKDKEKYKQLESIAKKKHEVEMEEWRKKVSRKLDSDIQNLIKSRPFWLNLKLSQTTPNLACKFVYACLTLFSILGFHDFVTS